MTRFQILGTTETIPLTMILPHEKQAMINHYQTITRLNERGGLDWTEALAVLEDHKYEKIDKGSARIRVLKLVNEFNKNN